MPVNFDIHPEQAQHLINKLIKFCGKDKIDKGIASYIKGLQCNPGIYGEYLRNRHPWWALLIEFEKVVASGKSFNRHILHPDGRIQHKWFSILEDAKRISEMYSMMTEDIRKFYRNNLVDDENARSHLFELTIAWHYLRAEHDVKWVQSGEKKPEFVVSKDGFEFCVECKRIGLGSYRKIRHNDFYRFCDFLLPVLSRRNLMGTINCVLDGSLPSQIEKQKEVSDSIIEAVQEGNDKVEFDYGELDYELTQANNVIVDTIKICDELNEKKEKDAFGVVFTDSKSNHPMNPIQFTCRSKQKNKYVKNIFKLIKKAAKEQLDKKMPGLVSVFLPEIDDFTILKDDGGLPAIATAIFSQERFTHVGCIVFNSDSKIDVGLFTITTFSQALTFKNSDCKFELKEGFPFLNQEKQNP